MNRFYEGENDRKRKGKQHASATNIDDEHPMKSKGDKDLFYFSILTGFIANDDHMWLVVLLQDIWQEIVEISLA